MTSFHTVTLQQALTFLGQNQTMALPQSTSSPRTSKKDMHSGYLTQEPLNHSTQKLLNLSLHCPEIPLKNK